MAEREVRRILEIYVAADCFGCAIARQRAVDLRARVLPDLDVHLIDLDLPGAVRHPAVFAVPTYLLDGRIISLGNPDERALLDRLGLTPAAGTA